MKMITKCVLTIALLSAASTVYAVPICNGHSNVETYDGKPAAVVTAAKRTENGYEFKYQYPNLGRVYSGQVDTPHTQTVIKGDKRYTYTIVITKGDSVAFVREDNDPKSVIGFITTCGGREGDISMTFTKVIQIP